MTTCSMSATVTGKPDRTEKSLEVTPGRSGPVRVIRRVRWSTLSQATGRTLTHEHEGPLSAQQQVGVTELVPQVPLPQRRLVGAGERLPLGDRGEHHQVAGPGLMQPGEQPAHGL